MASEQLPKTLTGPLRGPFFCLGFDHVAKVRFADARMFGGAKYMFFGAVGARRDAAHVDPVGLLERMEQRGLHYFDPTGGHALQPVAYTVEGGGDDTPGEFTDAAAQLIDQE